MKNNRGSLTIIAIFTVLLFSLYGVLLYARSASAYIRQSKAIETIQKAYAQDVPNAVHIAEQLGSTSTYVGPHYAIKFDFGNGNAPIVQNVIPGEKVVKPADPVGETGDFSHWYYLVEGGTESNPTYTERIFDFDNAPTQDYTLFAKYRGEAIMCSYSSSVAFWQTTYRENITSIVFEKGATTLPVTAIDSWNVKANNDCSDILAYVEYDETGNNTYKLTIVSPYTIYGNARGNSYFSGFTKLTSIDFSNFDTSKVLNMTNCFFGSSSLTNLNLNGFDTSNVTTFHQMFRECFGLQSLDLRSFHTSNVKSMSHMFMACSSLESVDVSSFDTSQVTTMRYMFGNCSGLKTLNLLNFNTSNVTDMSVMFYRFKQMSELDISSFDTRNVTNFSQMFNGCTFKRIYVGANWDTSLATNSSDMFANVSTLVGGNGTKRTGNPADATYARIDTAETPGYFTDKYIDLASCNQELEYIESTGTQYIDTGFIPNQDTSVTVQFQFNTLYTDGNTNKAIMGTRTSATSRSYTLICGGGNSFYSGFGATNTKTDTVLDKNVIYEIKKEKSITKLNGVTVATANSQSFTSPYSLLLFAGRNGSTTATYYSSMKLYSCQIWDNETLVRDYIPVYNATTHSTGLYDRVAGKFYFLQGRS